MEILIFHLIIIILLSLNAEKKLPFMPALCLMLQNYAGIMYLTLLERCFQSSRSFLLQFFCKKDALMSHFRGFLDHMLNSKPRSISIFLDATASCANLTIRNEVVIVYFSNAQQCEQQMLAPIGGYFCSLFESV